MIDFTIDTHIERPPSEVFAYVCDPDKLATWQTNTVSARQEGSAGFGLGTRLHEVHSAPGGKELASIVEVAEFEPDRVLALKVVEGTPIHVRITFEEDGDGTLMRFSPHGTLPGAMRLIEPLIAVTLKRQFKQHCQNLKRALEND